MPFAAHNFHIQDQAGNNVANASIEVRREIDGVLVTLYGDRDGTQILGNPFVSLTATGRFYVEGGCYKITATFGSSTIIWRHVAIGTAAEYDIEDLGGIGAAVAADQYATRAVAAATDLGDYVIGTLIRTIDYATAGDGGGAIYQRVNSNPGGNVGWFTAVDGSHWKLYGESINVLQFGAVADPGAIGAIDSAPAFTDAVNFINANAGVTTLVIGKGELYSLLSAPPQFTTRNVEITGRLGASTSPSLVNKLYVEASPTRGVLAFTNFHPVIRELGIISTTALSGAPVASGGSAISSINPANTANAGNMVLDELRISMGLGANYGLYFDGTAHPDPNSSAGCRNLFLTNVQVFGAALDGVRWLGVRNVFANGCTFDNSGGAVSAFHLGGIPADTNSPPAHLGCKSNNVVFNGILNITQFDQCEAVWIYGPINNNAAMMNCRYVNLFGSVGGALSVTQTVTDCRVYGRVADGIAGSWNTTNYVHDPIRELLTASRVYYVRKDGDDTLNNGRADTAVGAFKTIGRAMTELTRIDTNGFNVTVQVRADPALAGASPPIPTVYKEAVSLPNVVGYRVAGSLILTGDTANPSRIVIDQSNLVQSINTGTDEIVFTEPHGLSVNQEIFFRVMPGGTVPAVTGAPGGLLPQSPSSVFVHSTGVVNSTTIKIALTNGGAVADITSAGAGTIRCAPTQAGCITARGLNVSWRVQGFTLHALGRDSFGIENYGSKLEFGFMDFDQCGFAHILYSDQAAGNSFGSYNIRGKTVQRNHTLTQQQSQLVTINTTITSTLGRIQCYVAFSNTDLGVSLHRAGNNAIGTLITVDIATDRITWPAHGLANNEEVQIYPGALFVSNPAPPPLIYGKTYKAMVVDADTIQLSETSSTPAVAINLTATVTGTHRAISVLGPRRLLGDTCLIIPPTGDFPGTP